MLVITGTQRSGTSLIATALEKSGYDLGSSLWDEEVLGGFDNDIICGFYREYLGDPRFPFDDFDVPYVPVHQFRNVGYKVAKFCYLLMNPVFVMIWRKFRSSGDTFLVMDRDKKAVVASKLRVSHRFMHDSILLHQTVTELTHNFNDSLTLLDGAYSVRVLPFPACIDNLGSINRALTLLDPDVQIDPEVWKQVVDPTKVHFT